MRAGLNGVVTTLYTVNDAERREKGGWKKSRSALRCRAEAPQTPPSSRQSLHYHYHCDPSLDNYDVVNDRKNDSRVSSGCYCGINQARSLQIQQGKAYQVLAPLPENPPPKPLHFDRFPAYDISLFHSICIRFTWCITYAYHTRRTGWICCVDPSMSTSAWGISRLHRYNGWRSFGRL